MQAISKVSDNTNTGTAAGKPHFIEFEQCVLGGLLLDNSTYQSVSAIVSEQDFYGDDYKTIYRAIKSQADKGEPFDILTLGAAIESLGGLKESDTLQYLAVIEHDTPSAAASY